MAEVGKPALDQATGEVQRHCRPFVASQQQLRIGCAVLERKGGAVDQIATIARQGDAVAGFELGRAGFGVLAGKTPHPRHPPLHSVGEHNAHLQQNLEIGGDRVAATVAEALGTVAPLQ